MVQMTVATDLDDASFRRTANEIQQKFERIGEDVGSDFMSAFASGARTNSAKVEKAIDAARDATGRLATEQAKLDDLLARGDAPRAKLVQQSERAAKARRDEERAIRQAASAYEEYTQQGLRGAIAGAGTSGRDMADEFVGGFASSSALLRLGSAGGPIGLALAGVATIGVLGGRQLAEGIAQGLETLQMQDIFATRVGIGADEMGRFGDAAGAAYARGWGDSFEGNLKALQTSIQSGLIPRDATEAVAQQVVEQLQAVSKVVEDDPAKIARGVRNFVKTGLVSDYEDAFDLIIAATQNGLNVSDDLLDTLEEYGTKFRDLGITGQEALGLINQLWEGGARNTDVAADALKEFAINVVDSSDTTKTALTALGFDADDLTQKFAQGGPTAKAAFGAVLQALASVKDPMEQERIGLDLFKTKWEDVGDAIHNLDLPGAATELGQVAGATDEATGALQRHRNEWDALGRNIDETFRKFKEWLADSPIGKFFGQTLPYAINSVFDGPDTTWGSVPDTNVAPPQSPGELLLPPSAPAPQDPAGNGLPGLLGQLPLDGSPLPGVDADAPQRGPGMSYDDAAAQVADAKKAGSGSDAKPSFDPSQWSLESVPFGSFPGEEDVFAGAPQVGVAPGVVVSGSQMPTGPGYYEVDPQRVFDAETSRMNAQTSLQNARYRYLEVMGDADATEQDKYNAKAALIAQGRALQSAEMRLLEAQQGTWKKMEGAAKEFATGMDSLGAALDDDFGLGEGLSGFVENLIKTVGNLAAAPMLAQLNAISQASPIQGGHGLFGMFGAQNIAAGKSPLGFGTSSYAYGASALGPAAMRPGGGPLTISQIDQIAAQFGLTKSSGDRPGDDGYHGQGLAGDYSGSPQAMRAFADYMASYYGGSLLELIHDSPGFASNIKNGKGVGKFGDFYTLGQAGRHDDHVHIAADGRLSGGSGSGPVPVNVVNGSTLLSGFNWDAVAAKESGGDWANADTGRNGHYGGLQFSPSTWNAYGGQEFAPMPHLATREQQMAVADRTAFYGYNGTPPQGLGAWEVITNGSTAPAGITVNSRPPAFGGGGALPFMGAGAPQAAPFASGSVIAGQQPTGAPGAQGGGVSGVTGGLTGAALSAGAAGLDMLAPGAGQAAQTGIQLANRSIGYLAQLGGIAASGVLETLSFGGSNPNADPFKTLPGRVLAGIAGARPAIPNTAGQGQQQAQQQANANDPNQHNPGGPPGPLVNIEAVHQAPNQTPDSVANSVANQFKSAEISQGFRGR